MKGWTWRVRHYFDLPMGETVAVASPPGWAPKPGVYSPEWDRHNWTRQDTIRCAPTLPVREKAWAFRDNNEDLLEACPWLKS